MPNKRCDIHKVYEAGCSDCKEKSRAYYLKHKSSISTKPKKSIRGSIKACSSHSSFTAGCPDCQEKSRDYQRELKKRNTIEPINKEVSVNLWEKMAEIGKRLEK